MGKRDWVWLSAVKAVAALPLAALLLLGAPAKAAEVVGTTSAKFGVTPHGAASYSVPIAVPPGTMDLKPELVLQYNSHDENGLLGVGWTITGLSHITRCPTDMYVDDPAEGGIGIDPVDYDENDKFCLNGQLLVAESGAYGADGTEYRTNFEEFSRIISYGAIDGGPAWFRVWKRSGEILDYGATEDAKIRGQGRDAVRSWALSKLADAKGNYIAYSYHNDRANGEFRISRIDYTGNDAQGLAPYNHLAFTYEDRPDTVLAYHHGDIIQHRQRLKAVGVYAEGQLAHDYRLAYEIGVSSKSRIASITECGDATTCFKPTTFEWTESHTLPVYNDIALFEASTLGLTPSSGEHIYYPGDFNGDGRTDFIRGSKDYVYKVAYLANADGTIAGYSPAMQNSNRINGYSIHAMGDFNGDGLTDIYAVKSDDDGRAKGDNPDYILYANGNESFNQINVVDGLPKDYKVVGSGDFDGDGLTDIYLSYFHKFSMGFEPHVIAVAGQANNRPDQIWLTNPDGTFRKITSLLSDGLPDFSTVQSGDFNGDGRLDLLVSNVGSKSEVCGSSSTRSW